MRFRCPTPTCTFVFDTDQIPPSVALLGCPLCRVQFPYQAPGAAPELAPQGPPGVEAGLPPSGPTHAAAPELVPSGPTRAAGPDDASGFDGGPMIRVAPPRGSTGVLNSPLMYGVFLMFVGIGLAVAYVMTQPDKNIWRSQRSTTHVMEDFNISYDQPGGDWDAYTPSAGSARRGLDVNVFCMYRPEPESWVAMAVRDYKDFEPLPAEVQRQLRFRLRGYFENLQSDEIENATWAGKPAIAYYFSGVTDFGPMDGVSYAMSFQGIGYWFFAWAPSGTFDATLKEEFRDLRERVRFLKKRDDWQPKVETTVTFTPEQGNYQIQDTQGTWEKEDYAPADYSPDATIVLRARAGKKRELAVTAGVMVREVPAGGGDPLATAREAVLDRLNRELSDAGLDGRVTLEDYDEPIQRGIEKPPIPVARVVASNSIDAEQKALYVISALPIGEKLVVCEARGDQWAYREYWEPFLLQIAGSLRPK